MCICRKKKPKRAPSPPQNAIIIDGPKVDRASPSQSTSEKPKVDDGSIVEKQEEPRMDTAVEKSRTIVENSRTGTMVEEEVHRRYQVKVGSTMLDRHPINMPRTILEKKDDEEKLSISADKTQKSVVMEPDWNENYRNAERPIWVMDEKHDEIANHWLNKIPTTVVSWKGEYESLQKWRAKDITFHAYAVNEDLITISKPDVVPCQDQHRVIVRFPGLDNDYIHANYVGPKGNPKQFICSQTPQFEHNTHAFWAMVIQEKVEQIVSLEDSRIPPYIPKAMFKKVSVGREQNQIDIYHERTITRFENIVEYELRLNWGNGGHGRMVSVYHYPHWRKKPHYSEVILKLLQIVWNSRHTVVVHCYTGIGLSAVLIVAALVHQKMYDGEDGLNIMQTTKEVRRQRFGAVDCFEKYWAIQMTLRKFFEQECFNKHAAEPDVKYRRGRMKDRKVYKQ